jgi:DNA-binding response OmpR family regulator
MSKILIVEDDDEARGAIAAGLSAAGFAVVAVDSAEDALAQLKAQPGGFALIICDHNLAGMTGAALLRAAGRGLLTGVRVIMLSAFGEAEATAGAADALDPGALSYLAKPAPVAQVVAAARAKLAA